MRVNGVETMIVVRKSPPWGVGGQRAHTSTKQYIKMYICIIWREPARRAPGNFLSQGEFSGEEEERGKKGREGGDVTEADDVPVEGSLLLPPGRWWVRSMAPPSPGSDASQRSLKR